MIFFWPLLTFTNPHWPFTEFTCLFSGLHWTYLTFTEPAWPFLTFTNLFGPLLNSLTITYLHWPFLTLLTFTGFTWFSLAIFLYLYWPYLTIFLSYRPSLTLPDLHWLFYIYIDPFWPFLTLLTCINSAWPFVTFKTLWWWWFFTHKHIPINNLPDLFIIQCKPRWCILLFISTPFTFTSLCVCVCVCVCMCVCYVIHQNSHSRPVKSQNHT